MRGDTLLAARISCFAVKGYSLLSVRTMIATAAAIALAAAALSACCTGDIKEAPVVTIIDDVFDCAAEATITFSVDGGPEQRDECVLERGATGSCSCVTYLAEETAGTFEIVVRSSDGARQGSATVEVDDNACHIEPISATIHLE